MPPTESRTTEHAGARVGGRARRGVVGPWMPLAPFLYERSDGARVHVGGLAWRDTSERIFFFTTDVTRDPRWRLAWQLEPTRRRAMLAYIDAVWPLERTT